VPRQWRSDPELSTGPAAGPEMSRRSRELASPYAPCMGNLPDEHQLLSALHDAGWLLEQRAVRVLSERDLHPRAGWAYEDVDEPGTSRELDVWTYRQLYRDNDSKVLVAMSLLVECKQSSLPYVAIGQDLPQWRFSANPTEHVLPTQNLITARSPGRNEYTPAWNELGFNDLAVDNGGSRFRATQLTRLDRKGSGWSASNSGIFTSLVYPLAKALRASQVGHRTREHQLSAESKRDHFAEILLHFPVVLISCPLYVVDASTEAPVVERRPWVTARRELKSRNVTGTFDIDIVTEDAFARYVDQRIALAQAIADRVESDPLRAVGERIETSSHSA
jgi:hypothetical protein